MSSNQINYAYAKLGDLSCDQVPSPSSVEHLCRCRFCCLLDVVSESEVRHPKFYICRNLKQKSIKVFQTTLILSNKCLSLFSPQSNSSLFSAGLRGKLVFKGDSFIFLQNWKKAPDNLFEKTIIYKAPILKTFYCSIEAI